MQPVQNTAVINTFWEMSPCLAFFAWAFYEITDFKIELVLKDTFFCNIFHRFLSCLLSFVFLSTLPFLSANGMDVAVIYDVQVT